MLPVIPHLINECLNRLNYNKNIQWPKINQKYLKDENVEIVIQVNGKKRNTILVEKDIDEKNIISQINSKKLIEKYMNSGKLLKTIYVKNRLINYIINQK